MTGPGKPACHGERRSTTAWRETGAHITKTAIAITVTIMITITTPNG